MVERTLPIYSSSSSPSRSFKGSRKGLKLGLVLFTFSLLVLYRRQGTVHPQQAHPLDDGAPLVFDPAPLPEALLDAIRGTKWSDLDLAVPNPARVGPPPPPLPPTSESSPSSSQPPSAGDRLGTLEPPPPSQHLRSTMTDPWPEMSDEWIGRKVFERDTVMRPPPLLAPPPSTHLAAATEFAVRQSQSITAANHGVKYDQLTGRPLPVPRNLVWDGQDPASPLASKFKVGNAVDQPKWKPPKIDVTKSNGRKEAKRVQSQTRKRNGVVEIEGSIIAEQEREVQQKRQDYVRKAFLHCWQAYKDHAWGHDEIKPVSHAHSNGYNGWGATIIDSLDMLLVMNLTQEYNLARHHVAALDFSYLAPSGERTFSTELPNLDKMRPPKNDDEWEVVDQGSGGGRGGGRFSGRSSMDDQHSPETVSTFETIIRYVGGLIAAFDLSSDPLMLQRATELADYLLPALSTRHGLPLGRSRLGQNPEGGPSGRAILSEVGSLTLEFTRLSMLTGDPVYFHAAHRATETLNALPKTKDRGSLLATYVNAESPAGAGFEFSFGALADSFYEYLIKQDQLIGSSTPLYREMYERAIDSASTTRLIRPVDVVPDRGELLFYGLISYGGRFQPKMQHLTCFMGGTLALGAKLLERAQDLVAAVGVTSTCVWMYSSTVTGVGSESVDFLDIKGAEKAVERGATSERPLANADNRYLGRPETIESVLYLYRVTGDREYQDRGWEMFTSWVQYALVEYGFAGISNVDSKNHQLLDSQESFVLAETLKYYYLLFSPVDLISLDEFVFNTEAHPFFIPRVRANSVELDLVNSNILWSGPDLDAPPEFVSTQGEGTTVQKWARVTQAADLARKMSPREYSLAKDEGRFGAKKGEREKASEYEFKGFIKPSRKELIAAALNQG